MKHGKEIEARYNFIKEMETESLTQTYFNEELMSFNAYRFDRVGEREKHLFQDSFSYEKRFQISSFLQVITDKKRHMTLLLNNKLIFVIV